MHTLHIRADDDANQELLKKVDQLIQSGRHIELLDEKTLVYEKGLIDRALKDIKEGKIQDSDEIWNDLA